MKLFGWSTAKARKIEFAQVRAARNAAAITTNVGNAAVAGDGVVAARIHRDEIEEADRILRCAQDRQYRLTTAPRRCDYHADEFTVTMHKRLGAAAAVEAVADFAPILQEEVERIEDAVADLRDMGKWDDSMLLAYEGRMLVADLYFRLGHAEAIEHLGSIPVFASQLQGEQR